MIADYEDSELLKLFSSLRRGIVEHISNLPDGQKALVRSETGTEHLDTTPSEGLWTCHYGQSLVSLKEGDLVLVAFMDLEQKTNGYIVQVLDKPTNGQIIGTRPDMSNGSFVYQGNGSGLAIDSKSPNAVLVSGKNNFNHTGKYTSIVNDGTVVAQFSPQQIFLKAKKTSEDSNPSFLSLSNLESKLFSAGKLMVASAGEFLHEASLYVGKFKKAFNISTTSANLALGSASVSSTSWTHRIISRASEVAATGSSPSKILNILRPSYSVTVGQGAISFGTAMGSIKNTIMTPDPTSAISLDVGFQGAMAGLSLNGRGEINGSALKSITLKTPISLTGLEPSTTELDLNTLGIASLSGLISSEICSPPSPLPLVPPLAQVKTMATGMTFINGATMVDISVPNVPTPSRTSGTTYTPASILHQAPIIVNSKTPTGVIAEPLVKGFQMLALLQTVSAIFDTHIHFGILGPVSPPPVGISAPVNTWANGLITTTTWSE